jgi:hypothetical protein
MAGRVDWHGNQFVAGMNREMKRRTNTAAIRLKNRIQAEISQSGRLVYHPIGKSGKVLKRTRTIRNFTHSAPGNPPFSQTGQLHDSITREILAGGIGGPTWIGRVGTWLKKGRYLELGTRSMRRRPYLVITLRRYEGEIVGILTAKIGPGQLADIVSNQFRSGIMGRGF